MRISEKIADNLMKNSDGEVATRLVLELPAGGNCGGRCRSSIISVIDDALIEFVRSIQVELNKARGEG